MKYKYFFNVKAIYQYKIVAKTEQQARKILEEKGGLDIEGELLLDSEAYSNAYVENVEVEYEKNT